STRRTRSSPPRSPSSTRSPIFPKRSAPTSRKSRAAWGSTTAHDPVGMEQARKELPDIEYCKDPYACVRGTDALVIITEWAQFRALDLKRLKREMAQPVIVDLRNIYRPDDVAALGFIFESIGRRRTNPINLVE